VFLKIKNRLGIEETNTASSHVEAEKVNLIEIESRTAITRGWKWDREEGWSEVRKKDENPVT
jgi:hypothetical protein